eukprot:2181104-Rhodomonas_salina.1
MRWHVVASRGSPTANYADDDSVAADPALIGCMAQCKARLNPYEARGLNTGRFAEVDWPRVLLEYDGAGRQCQWLL